MLTFFSVKNYRGFRNTISLDLTSSNYTFNNECVKDGYAHKALIYGYNGVGKSNFGLAIMDISINLTDNEKPSNYLNFINLETEDEIVEFEYQFKFQDFSIKYIYGKNTPEAYVYEYFYINNKCVVFYNRTKNEPLRIDLPGAETLIKDINKISISVLKYIKSNAVLEKTPETSVLFSFFNFVNKMLLFKNLEERMYIGYVTGTRNIFEEIINKNHFNEFINFLSSAELPSNIVYKNIGGQNRVFFSYTTEQKNINEIDFFPNCSTGMKTLTILFFWLQNALFNKEPPSFVFIDEFDAFYDQRLSEFVIKKIKEISNCQFILTTHDTGVMSNDIMRPDCLFLMHKDRINSLSNLTEKELRYAHNIEKMYRAGAFNE